MLQETKASLKLKRALSTMSASEAEIQKTKQTLYRTSREKLKKKCKSMKISAEGQKKDMIERIIKKMYMEHTETIDVSHSSQQQYTRPASIADYTTKTINGFAAELQKWVEYVLELKFTHSFFEELKLGVVLCKLLNKVKAGTCSGVEKPERLYVQKRNIRIYLSGCRALKVPKVYIYSVNDLVVDWKLKSNQRKILSNLHYVIKMAKKAQIDAAHVDIHEPEFVRILRLSNISSSDSPIASTPCLSPNFSDSSSLKKRKFKMLDQSITNISQKPKASRFDMDFQSAYCIHEPNAFI